jgi:hypothetical protein
VPEGAGPETAHHRAGQECSLGEAVSKSDLPEKEIAMKRLPLVFGAMVMCVGLFPFAGSAETLLLESTAPRVESLEGLKVCDDMHHVRTCDIYHIEPPFAYASTETLILNGKAYRIEWSGKGYYLESGLILQQQANHEWVEVYPNHGTVHPLASWNDVDKNGAVGIGDRLELGEGTFDRVIDVRLHIKVSSVPALH